MRSVYKSRRRRSPRVTETKTDCYTQQLQPMKKKKKTQELRSLHVILLMSFIEVVLQ